MFLFFDTETTGLPARWNAPVTDVNNWPRLVQLAWVMCDGQGQIMEECNHIIRPEGFTIPEAVARLHGITTERAQDEGADLGEVLWQFSAKLDEATALVGHNISFDTCIVGAEFERARMMTTLFLKPTYCTMKLSTSYCKLPNSGGRGYKRPKLSELHRTLFGRDFEQAHNALADVRATVACFWKLRELGLV